MDYYEGEQAILERKKEDGAPNNKLVCNHAKDISDTATSYFIGEPVTYKSDDDISDLLKALENAGADEADGDNGLDLSIYGLAFEYMYAKEGQTELVCKNLSPLRTFMVYDDTIEQNELFAVYYYQKKMTLILIQYSILQQYLHRIISMCLIYRIVMSRRKRQRNRSHIIWERFRSMHIRIISLELRF